MAVKKKFAAALLRFIDEVSGLREEWDDLLLFYILEGIPAAPASIFWFESLTNPQNTRTGGCLGSRRAESLAALF